MKFFLFIFLAFVVSGCGAANTNFRTWKGAPIDNAVAQFGDQTETLYKAENAFYWDLIFDVNISPQTSTSAFVIGNQVHATSYHHEGYTYPGRCAFAFIVDNEGTIIKSMYDGSDCDNLAFKRNPYLAY